jgi:hypothetical protein
MASPGQGDDLGVRAAESFVMADADHPGVAYYQGANHRVGLDRPPATLGLGQGPSHP